MRKIIQTNEAPQAIGTYSQAVQIGDIVYLSGQIGLDPATAHMAEDIDSQIHRVLQNLRAVARAAGGDLGGIAKLNVFLTDLANFGRVNEIMTEYFEPPYPARAAVGVAALPRGALVEIDAILALGGD